MLMLRWRHVETCVCVCVCVFLFLVLKGRLWHFPAKSYLFRMAYIIFMAGQPTSPNVPAPEKSGLIRPQGNQWLIKALFFWGGDTIGGVRLTSHKISNLTGGPSPGVQETHLSFWSGKWGHLWRGMRSSWEGIGCFQWPKRKGSSLQCLQVTSLTSKEL